jgi:predicted nucleotidyltransferase
VPTPPHPRTDGLRQCCAGRARRSDLDIGVLPEPDATVDLLALIRDLDRATEADVDVVVLNAAGPVLRERALVGSVVLDESEPGAWASAWPAAVLERMDTEWLRRLDLDLLADR